MGVNLLLRKILILTLIMLCTGVASAQGKLVSAQLSKKITGTIVDENGSKMVGVSIILVGTHRGVTTNADGEYTIYADNGSVLRFSFVGYALQEIKVAAGKSVIDVRLKENVSAIDNVVVTGYSETSMRKSTGSVGMVTSAELKDAPLRNVDMLLQGKIAGVNVQAVSGRPGEVGKIRIRGTSTITGNAEPLWVVDGVPLQKEIPKISSSQIRAGDFTDIFATGIGGINPNDIETIHVLKDAASAAIYGSRASGGVIVVTTKRGKSGPMLVNYSANISVNTKPQRDANLMNSREKLAWEQELWDEFSASGFKSGGHYPVIGIVGQIRSGYGKYAGATKSQQDLLIEELGKSTTDWFDELFQSSVSQSHNLSLSGGNDKTSYYVSMGYSNNNGLVKKTDYTRYNFNAKLGIKPNRRLSIEFISDYSTQISRAPSGSVDMFQYAYFANPYEKMHNTDGTYRADETYFKFRHSNGSYEDRLPERGFNIMREINETSNKTQASTTSLQSSLSYKIAENLTFSGLASFRYNADDADNINGKNTYAAFKDRPFDDYYSQRVYGSISQNMSYSTEYMLRGQLSYGKTFKQIHRINANVGSEIRRSHSKSIFEKRYGYDPVSGNHSTPLPPTKPDGTIDYSKLVSFANIMDGLAGQSIVDNAMASFYGTVDYILKSKYAVNFTARTDGANNFGSKEQFNPNWSVGFAWNVDQEPFMRQIAHVISSFTFKASTGFTGNINKSVYPQLVMNYSPSFRKTYDDMYRIGSIKNAPNPFLRWEKTWDIKAGVDIGFVDDKIRTSIEVYNRKGIDMVTSEAVPYTTGFSTQSFNTSEQVNQGVEFSIYTVNISTKDFRWTTSANVSYNLNKLTKYEPVTGSVYRDNFEGYPQGKIFTGRPTGINPTTGVYNYELRPDAVVNNIADLRKTENYLFYVGTSNAPVTGGFSTGLTYKNLTVSIGGTFSLNSKIINDIASPASYQNVSVSGSQDKEPIPTQLNDLYIHYMNVRRDVVNRWTPDNPRTDAYPRIIDAYGQRLYLDRDMPTSSYITNSTMLERLSYFKISSISVIYNLPEKLVEKAKLNNVGVSFTMNNLFTFTNYKGIDPETPGAVYPQTRSISFGLNIGF